MYRRNCVWLCNQADFGSSFLAFHFVCVQQGWVGDVEVAKETLRLKRIKIRFSSVPNVFRNSIFTWNPNRATKMDLKTQEINRKNSQKDDAWGVPRR